MGRKLIVCQGAEVKAQLRQISNSDKRSLSAVPGRREQLGPTHDLLMETAAFMPNA